MMGDFEAAERIGAGRPVGSAVQRCLPLYVLVNSEPGRQLLEPARRFDGSRPDSYYRVDALIYALLRTGRTEEAGL
jgi:hypothetical protein